MEVHACAACTHACMQTQLLPTYPFVHAQVIQLFETTIVRHGLMLVGPTMGGKTCCYRSLQKAMTSLNTTHPDLYEKVKGPLFCACACGCVLLTRHRQVCTIRVRTVASKLLQLSDPSLTWAGMLSPTHSTLRALEVMVSCQQHHAILRPTPPAQTSSHTHMYTCANMHTHVHLREHTHTLLGHDRPFMLWQSPLAPPPGAHRGTEPQVHHHGPAVRRV